MDDAALIEAYLDRLGLTTPDRPDLDALRALHAAHLMRVPFENLSIHLGEPISLGRDDLADKVLHRRRGGFCYELNGLFGMLLTALGYQVTLLAAQVWTNGAYGPPLDHLTLRVRVPGEPGAWLADVGFGTFSHYPLRLAPGPSQRDPAGSYSVELTERGDWELWRGGERQFLAEPRPRSLPEFTAMCWYQQTSPDSPFVRGPVCTKATPDGRVTLSGTRLIRTRNGSRQESVLDGDAAVLDTYRTEFGIVLDRVPRIPDQPDGWVSGNWP